MILNDIISTLLRKQEKLKMISQVLYFLNNFFIFIYFYIALDSGLILEDIDRYTFCIKEKECYEDNKGSKESDELSSDGKNSISSAKSNYNSPLNVKRQIIFQRDLKLEKRSFWGFFLCRC